SCRRRPLNASMKGLSVGVPGRLNASLTPCRWAQASRALEANSGPLSTWRICGKPYRAAARSKTATTRWPVSERSTSIAGLSRLLVSRCVKERVSLSFRQTFANEIHAHLLVGGLSRWQQWPQGAHPLPADLAAPREPFEPIQAVHAFVIDAPTFPAQQGVQSSI